MSVSDPVTLFRSALRTAAEREAAKYRRKHRLMIAAAVSVITVLAAGAALATNSWLAGEAAPPSVVADFGTYTPQLGFHPDPGRAVLVARDGDSSLYATTNKEGSYCIVVSAPWWRPEVEPDGGTCIGQIVAAQRIAVGIVSVDSAHLDRKATVLVAGRVSISNATRVAFTSRAGDTITRSLSASGFFLAAIDQHFCTGDWTSTFTVFDDRGRQLAQSAITLEHVLKGLRGGVACATEFTSDKGSFMYFRTDSSSAP